MRRQSVHLLHQRQQSTQMTMQQQSYPDDPRIGYEAAAGDDLLDQVRAYDGRNEQVQFQLV